MAKVQKFYTITKTEDREFVSEVNRSECKNSPLNTLSRSLCVTEALHWLQLSVCFSGGWELTELWARPRSS